MRTNRLRFTHPSSFIRVALRLFTLLAIVGGSGGDVGVGEGGAASSFPTSAPPPPTSASVSSTSSTWETADDFAARIRLRFKLLSARVRRMRGRPWGDGEHATAAAFFEARKHFVMKTGALDRLGEFWAAKDAKEVNEAKGVTVRETALKDTLKDTETEEAEETETATAATAAVQVDVNGAASALSGDSAIPLSSSPTPPPPSPTLADQDVCADLELGGAPAEFDSMGNFYCLRLHHLLFQRDQMRYLL